MTGNSPSKPQTNYGWSIYAESWNGRLAMLGLLIGVVTEVFTGQGILSQIGLL